MPKTTNKVWLSQVSAALKSQTTVYSSFLSGRWFVVYVALCDSEDEHFSLNIYTTTVSRSPKVIFQLELV